MAKREYRKQESSGTKEDAESKLLTMLVKDEWSQKTYKAIAAECGVPKWKVANIVAKLREEYEL